MPDQTPTPAPPVFQKEEPPLPVPDISDIERKHRRDLSDMHRIHRLIAGDHLANILVRIAEK